MNATTLTTIFGDKITTGGFKLFLNNIIQFEYKLLSHPSYAVKQIKAAIILMNFGYLKEETIDFSEENYQQGIAEVIRFMKINIATVTF